MSVVIMGRGGEGGAQRKGVVMVVVFCRGSQINPTTTTTTTTTTTATPSVEVCVLLYSRRCDFTI